ncbi:hypothetical protein EIP91_000264 [Steccherinum ochraceum]|uniref:Protein kinase domain-containing protein n=1 Tax=Steccherinum ochraceum TaxID=92696 RepID=A0A4R0RKB6_9APHY|nr:hypothetical protein EIP91_000264 [Steccherinum ochraceum]
MPFAREHVTEAYADVFCGRCGGVKVAPKRVRVYMVPDELKEELQKAFCKELILWTNLAHKHALLFMGISNDVFKGAICIVVPWMENGTLRSLVNNLSRAKSSMDSLDTFTGTLDRSQTSLGLEYLHQESDIHSNLHAGDFLVDEHGSALSTDLGLALIADGTAYNYDSHHGGELFAPEDFGLDSGRPISGDLYALALVCIELYTRKLPFPEITNRHTPLRVVKGERLHRPLPSAEGAMSNAMWTITQACWTQTPSLQPTARAVTELLRSAVESLGKPIWHTELRLTMIQSVVEARLRELLPT